LNFTADGEMGRYTTVKLTLQVSATILAKLLSSSSY